MEPSIRAKNKEQDFSDLEKASETMQNKMRMDEDYPDLFNQLQYRSDIAGCHRYFIEPYKSAFGPMVEHSTFVPFPKEILQQYSRIECASFMGILPEIHRVWVTVDNILYLWNYQKPEEFEVYDGVSEVIVSVTISTPKPGIFLDSVKYLLVLATPVEIIILALCCDEQSKQVKIIPTTYNLPSDNVTMLKIVGSQPGRVFMVGNDNNLYELEYSNNDSNWASSLLNGISGPQRKCRKVNHFAWEWQVTNLLPNFIAKGFGGQDDQFADMVVDNARNILYAVTAHGKLTAIYLGMSGYETHIFERSFDIIEQTQRYLSMAMGMRSAGTPHPSSFTNTSSPGFQIVGIFPVPITESKRIQLIVVLANGIRIYLSLEGEYGGRYNGIGTVSAGGTVPQRLSIVAVRSPPSTTTVANCAASSSSFEDSSGDLENGSIPTFVPSQQLAISRAYYSQGVFMLTLDKLQQPDELLCIFEDILSRSTATTTTASTSTVGNGGRTNTESVPCLKEGVTLSLDATASGGKIFDIKESCHYSISDPVVAQMQSLFAFSKVPGGSTSNLIRETTHHVHPETLPRVVVPTGSSDFLSSLIESEDKVYNDNSTPLTFSNAMSMSSSKASKFGIEKQNMDNLALLGEISSQHIPLADKVMNRQLLVLTNSGIHIFKKNRPADLLYDILSRVDLRADELMRRFFHSFGVMQSSIMCIGLATGVPRHVGHGSAAFSDPLAASANSTSLVVENLQYRAMNTVLTSTPGPTYRALIPAAGYAAIQDSRLIQNDNARDFIPSVAHDAMYSFLGRVVRPIWFRAVIDNHTRKVSKMWSQALIEEIRQPLNNLKNLIAGFYSAAIRGDSHHTMGSVTKRRVATAGFSSTDLVTSHIANQSRQQISGEKALAFEAKSIEDSSIRCLYNLISRTLHALSLIELLLTVEQDWKINIRELSDLNNFSFRSIVVLPKLHDQIKRVIQQLIHTLIRSNKADLADRAIAWLSDKVYHYFSAGDRFTFEATKRLDVISRAKQTNDHSISANDVNGLTAECIKLFQNAVTYWNSPEYVVGDQSELVSTCASLLTLGPLGRDAIVDLCLKAASNFTPQSSSSSAGDHSSSNAWDAALYHGGSVLTDRDRSNSITACHDCLIKQILWLGSRQSMIGSGVLVPDSMAAASPAEIEQETLRMIKRAVSSSDDLKFHERLYSRLLTDDSKLLLHINSPFIEEFLKTHDANLLHSYYIASLPDRGPQYMKAANLMYILATNADEVHIDQRIEFLRKAVTSAKEALGPQHVAASTNPYVGKGGLYSSSSSASMSMADKLLVDNLQELEDLLDVAEFQSEIASRLDEDFKQFQATSSSSGGRAMESLNQQLRLMKEWVRKLKLKLLTISELFNDVCVEYNMWDMSLRLLQMSNTVDEELIARLWRSFIYKFVPSQTSSNDARDFLLRKKDKRFVEVDGRLIAVTNQVFEQPSSWLSSLRSHVADLAAKLKIDESSPFCPLPLLVQELEDILSTLHIVVGEGSPQQQNIPRDYVSGMLRDLRVPTLYIVDVYFWLLDQWKQHNSEKQIHLLASILDFIETWINFAKSDNSEDRGYLELAISGSHMRRWLADIGKLLSTLKRDNRWADLIQIMLKKEYDISTSIYDFHPK